MNSDTLLSECNCSFVELDWFVHFDEPPQVGDLAECLDAARLVDDKRAAIVEQVVDYLLWDVWQAELSAPCQPIVKFWSCHFLHCCRVCSASCLAL